MAGQMMRRNAARRAEEMRQRVPYRKPAAPSFFQEPEKKTSAEQESGQPIPLTNSGMKQSFGGLEQLLRQFDADHLLILALLMMLYKDGGSKKLMLALAYLLT